VCPRQVKATGLYKVKGIFLCLEPDPIRLEQAAQHRRPHFGRQNAPGVMAGPGDVDKGLNLHPVAHNLAQVVGDQIQVIILHKDDDLPVRVLIGQAAGNGFGKAFVDGMVAVLPGVPRVAGDGGGTGDVPQVDAG
jgi:hypothetical protein